MLEHSINLRLAIAVSCTAAGCRVQLLEDGASVDAALAGPVIDHGITVESGHLVVLDGDAEPPQVVCRCVLSPVERMEGERAVVRGPCGLADVLLLPEWLVGEVTAGDHVFIALDQVYDVARDGRPAHPGRLRAALFPRVAAMYARIAATRDVDPRRIVEEGYDRIAERHLEWAQVVRAEERARYTAILLERLPPGAEVLDLGCGAGVPTTQALARHFRVTGVDISARQLALARQHVPGARFIRADITRLDLAHARFDGIAAFYALIHVPRDEQACLLQRIAAWLRPGGLLVATMSMHASRGDVDDFLGVPMHWSGFDAQANRRLVEAAGLEILSAQEERAEEFGRPVSFLWVVARKPAETS